MSLMNGVCKIERMAIEIGSAPLLMKAQLVEKIVYDLADLLGEMAVRIEQLEAKQNG